MSDSRVKACFDTLMLRNFDFSVSFSEGECLTSSDFDSVSVTHQKDSLLVIYGRNNLEVRLSFEPIEKAVRARAACVSPSVRRIAELSLSFTYPLGPSRDEWRILHTPQDLPTGLCGAIPLEAAARTPTLLTSPSGLFKNHNEPGLYLATVLPQSNVCVYRWNAEADGVRFICTTRYNDSKQAGTSFYSETIFLSTEYTILSAIHTFAAQYPKKLPLSEPQCGFSTWDYYYSSVSMNDVLENICALENLPQTRRHVHIIQIDDGWQYLWGEWEPNYKFPSLRKIADTIQEHGYQAGIWTAPILVAANTHTALRNPTALAKNAQGDPAVDPATKHFLIDPTAPAGEQFLRELFTRLYAAGFRYFKVDYVSPLLNVPCFYDQTAGVYDAIRRLFSIIRECVRESHILGCSLPYAAGADLVDSGRTGIDIHNQWSHVRWAMSSYAVQYWLQNRIWVNDIDYLVVRGTETSTEKVTTVTDPKQHAVPHPRWRSGPTFNAVEAETWVNIVKMSGSNLFWSDRISAVNEKGLALAETAFPPQRVSGVPVDLMDGELPSLWLQEKPGENVLTVVNWEDTPIKKVIRLADYAIKCPEQMMVGDQLVVPGHGEVLISLPAHGSCVLAWRV